jgi:hypothetical protein
MAPGRMCDVSPSGYQRSSGGLAWPTTSMVRAASDLPSPSGVQGGPRVRLDVSEREEGAFRGRETTLRGAARIRLRS